MHRSTYYNLILAHELFMLSLAMYACQGALLRRMLRDMFGGDVAKYLAEPLPRAQILTFKGAS